MKTLIDVDPGELVAGERVSIWQGDVVTAGEFERLDDETVQVRPNKTLMKLKRTAVTRVAVWREVEGVFVVDLESDRTWGPFESEREVDALDYADHAILKDADWALTAVGANLLTLETEAA